MLQQNIGTIDAIMRAALGSVLLLSIAFGPRTWWGLVGVIPLSSAILRTCPLYTVIGLRTCPQTCQENGPDTCPQADSRS